MTRYIPGDYVRPINPTPQPATVAPVELGDKLVEQAALDAAAENARKVRDSLSRRLGPVFAEMAAQAAAENAQQGPKSGQEGVENPNPMPTPSRAYKPAHGGYPGTPVLRHPQPFC